MPAWPPESTGGHILDPDGDPAAGYEIVISARRSGRNNTYRSVDQTTTNQAGEYRFDGLTPDAYRVCAGRETAGVAVKQIPVDSQGKPTRLRELWTFYPGALSAEGAQAVKLVSGQERSDIDIQIERGPLLTVKGRVAGFLDSPSKYHLGASVQDGVGWTTENAKLNPDGEFVVELPPGKHEIYLLDQTTSGPKRVAKTEIDLVDQDISGVVIAPLKPAQVSIRVIIEGEEDKPVTAGTVFLNSYDSDQYLRNTFLQYQPRNGIYVIDDVPAGKYHVSFNNASGCYLKSVQSAGKVLDHDAIDVPEGGNLNLLLTYSKKVATVTGSVEIDKDQSKHAIRVMLVPSDRAWLGSAFNLSELDQTLHFSLEHLRPGKYLAFACQENSFDVWGNAEFVGLLESEGVSLQLHENEHTNIHLKLIPKSATDRVRQQLGL